MNASAPERITSPVVVLAFGIYGLSPIHLSRIARPAFVLALIRVSLRVFQANDVIGPAILYYVDMSQNVAQHIRYRAAVGKPGPFAQFRQPFGVVNSNAPIPAAAIVQYIQYIQRF
jgi:hypothetical protein